MGFRAAVIGILLVGATAFVPNAGPGSKTLQLQAQKDGSEIVDSRREVFKTVAALSGGALASTVFPAPSFASGGATAGKYTTIPIAKRRYYGRVQQGVHDFLAMMPELANADTTGAKCQFFFDTSGVVIVEARRQDSTFAGPNDSVWRQKFQVHYLTPLFSS